MLISCAALIDDVLDQTAWFGLLPPGVPGAV
jgi:hypothetical protein